MAAQSKIEWTDASVNPIRARRISRYGPSANVGWHCEKVTAGCAGCYAETMNKRLGTGLEFKPGNRDKIELFLDEEMLLAPLSWRKPRRIFVCSMTDLFANFVPDEWIDRMFAVMAKADQHIFQVLTKRSARMREYLRDEERHATILDVWCRLPGPSVNRVTLIGGQPVVRAAPSWPLPNVWLGSSCHDQPSADEIVPQILATPAAMRFVSCEPMIGPIKLTEVHEIGVAACKRFAPRLDWVICGGESGPNARPMHPDWARSLRDQCAERGVPFFFKQWGKFRLGEYQERVGPCIHWQDGEKEFYGEHQDIKYGDHWLSNENGKITIAYPCGKKRAGRLLDGIEHNGMPVE